MTGLVWFILGVVIAIVAERLYKLYIKNQEEAAQILRNTQALTAADGRPVPWVANVTYKLPGFGGLTEQKVMVMAKDPYDADSEIRALIKLRAAPDSNPDVDTPRVATPEEYHRLKGTLPSRS
jgi:hypothetical protein